MANRNHVQLAEDIVRAQREPVSVSVHADTLSIRIGVERVPLTADQATDLANRLVEAAEAYRQRQATKRLEEARASRELRDIDGGAA